MVELAVNGSGIRDTARVLRISPTTVSTVLKKVPVLQLVNTALLQALGPRGGDASVQPGREAEGDEMWSFVGDKDPVRWLWHAIDHRTGMVLAYVVGTRTAAVFLKLQALLAPFGIRRYDTDQGGAYQRHLPPEQHTVGKLPRQELERQHLRLRRRLKGSARQTLYFSRSCVMPDLVIGLYMNRVEFDCEG